jgi:hypothetical protein
MDLSPPALTRSPTPTSNQYCRSQRSSIDYPSPILLDQHYKIASSYGSEQQCSMAQPMEPDHALPSVETMASGEWASPTMIHSGPASASGPMPAIMSSDYETFGSYASPMQTSYTHHDVYASHHHHHHQHHHHTPQPTSPNNRSDAARSPHYASPRQQQATYGFGPSHDASTPSPMAPRARMVESHGPYPGAEPSPYASSSPRSIQTSYVPETGLYHQSTYMPEPPTAASWPKPEYEPDTFYPGGPAAAQMQQAGVTTLQDARRVFKLAARHNRRPPRRLTTREEANFQCEVKGCGKLFSRSYNYKAHMLTHDEKREYPFPCPIDGCNKKFVRKTDLQRHNQSVHMKERNHKCDYCGRLFARKDTLRRHMDDGCSKRFDIGTVDIRETYELAPNRSFSGSFSHILPPQTTLPPLAMPTSELPPLLAPMPHSMRDRSILAAGDHGHDHAWSR